MYTTLTTKQLREGVIFVNSALAPNFEESSKRPYVPIDIGETSIRQDRARRCSYSDILAFASKFGGDVYADLGGRYLHVTFLAHRN